MEDTPLLPRLRVARKVGESAGMNDCRSGRMVAVSEWNNSYQTRAMRKDVYIPL